VITFPARHACGDDGDPTRSVRIWAWPSTRSLTLLQPEDPGLLSVPVDDAQVLPAVVSELQATQIEVTELALRLASLDEVFMALTGHTAAEGFGFIVGVLAGQNPIGRLLENSNGSAHRQWQGAGSGTPGGLQITPLPRMRRPQRAHWPGGMTGFKGLLAAGGPVQIVRPQRLTI
jgi:hypothetical protein